MNKYNDNRTELNPLDRLTEYSRNIGWQASSNFDSPVILPTEKATNYAEPEDKQISALPKTKPERVNNEQDFTPVVAWLVGIAGGCRGKDFALHAGYNYIGRSPENDICIADDMYISAQRHAMVAYSPRGNDFTFAPVSGHGIVSVNDEDVFMPVKLKMRDIIQIGNSKFYFVPLCDDQFDWNKF